MSSPPHELTPPADLYDGRYRRRLRGRWLNLSMGFVLVVEGRGSRRGTVAAHAEHDPDNRADAMPITTLEQHYIALR